MATLRDIAERAGVSIATASIVISGKAAEKRISPATAQKVLACMEALHYVPAQRTSHHSGGKSTHKVIGFFFSFSTHFGTCYERFNSVIESKQVDYEVVIHPYIQGRLKERLLPVLDGRYQGLIIGGTAENDMELLKEMKLQIPVVLLDREAHKYSSVVVNCAQLGFQAAIMLTKKQYTECALIGPDNLPPTASSRSKMFLIACKQLGITVKPEWIFRDNSSFSGGARATDKYCKLENRPRVIFYETDVMAQGGLRRLRDQGIRVPDDVEILAIGNTDDAHMFYLTPSISCICVSEQVDKMSMELLIKLIEEGTDTPLHVELEPVIHLRESFQL